MKTRYALAVAALAVASPATLAAAEPPAPQIKVLEAPADPTAKTVLVGRSLAGGMVIQFELEPAKGMVMMMGNRWGEHGVAAGERYHVEVKPIDPMSKTRISYADVRFAAINKDTGQTIEAALHPMWGGSGLHYAINSQLVGDGIYAATITVGVPTFARDPKAKDLWMQPASATFHFKLADGKLIEVSEPSADAGS